jgi:hypothetical protein
MEGTGFIPLRRVTPEPQRNWQTAAELLGSGPARWFSPLPRPVAPPPTLPARQSEAAANQEAAPRRQWRAPPCSRGIQTPGSGVRPKGVAGQTPAPCLASGAGWLRRVAKTTRSAAPGPGGTAREAGSAGRSPPRGSVSVRLDTWPCPDTGLGASRPSSSLFLLSTPRCVLSPP